MKNVTDKLKLLVADTKVLHSKLGNYQWNANDLMLHELEERIDYYINHFSVLRDTLTERILQMGDLPPVTMREALQSSRINEDDFSKLQVDLMVEGLINDFTFLICEFKLLREEAKYDLVVSSLVTEQLEFLDRELALMENAKDYNYFAGNEDIIFLENQL